MSQTTNIKYTLRLIVSYLTAFVTFITSIFTGGGVIDLSKVTAADYEHIKTAYTQMIIGPDNIDMSDASITSKINGMVAWGLSRQGTLTKDGAAPWLGVEKITSSADISTVYTNIFAMAKAYACKYGSSYKEPSLLADIRYSLDWMYDNCYGGKVNAFTKFGNWWDWEIGAPTNLVGTLILMEESLGRELVDKYLYPVNFFVPLPERTSANLVDSAYIAIGAGALQEDGIKLVKSRNKLDEVFKYVTGGDGFYTDGSYVMHVDIPYQGGYGTIMLEALSRVVLALDDTFFEISGKNIAVQAAWAFDSFMPLMYKGGLPGMVRGRNIFRNTDDIGIGFAAVTGMLRMTKYTNSESSKKLSAAVKYYYSENSARYVDASSIFDLCLLKDLAADETVQAMDAFNEVKVFSKMDRVSKLTKDYSIGIAMASKRIAKYEAINNENGKGWYTGDGMLYIQNTPYDYNYDYWRDVNYYRMPGTTVTTRERTQKNIALKCLPNTAFAGGVALDNCAVAAMQLLGVTTEFSSTLKAKKAWFLFDDEIVALGADISCSDDFSTETVIENRLINENSVFSAGGSNVNEREGTLINPKAIYLSGFGGIYLPADSAINYRRIKPGSEFLELWINHGKNFKQDTYAYAVLPAKTDDEVADYANNPEFEIIANNASIQAVRENKLGVTGYVFHQKFKFDEIAVDKPCIILKKQTDDMIKFTICDPTQAMSKIVITLNVNGFKAGTSAGNIKCVISDETATLTVNTCNKSGLGSEVTFIKDN